MSASLARLRKRAAELEQKKQFDRALEVYVQILDEGGKDLDDEDVPLFNRVGDMLMRKGSVTEALGFYERAVDMYAERGYLNNAIALCSKILRQSPGRAAVYYKLARISAKKGFKSDARKNFLEYADRMQKLGMADEAFRALKEFASLYPDQDDVRLILAELLSKENRKGEALEQLQSLYEKLQSEGRAAEARATIDRMRAIDPSATPREGTRQPTPAPVGDLIFLDLNDAESSTGTPRDSAQPASARAPVPSPVPALTGLSITFFPADEPAAPHPEGFESTAVEPEPIDTVPVTRSLTPAGSELVVEPIEPERASQRDLEPIVPLDIINEEPQPLERIEQALEDLAPQEPATRPPSRTPPPLTSFQFADLDLDGNRAESARGHDLNLPGEMPPARAEVTPLNLPLLESAAAAEDARAAAEEAADLAADLAAREAGMPPLQTSWAVTLTVPEVPNDPQPEQLVPEMQEPVVQAPEAPAPEPQEPVLEGRRISKPVEEIPDDFLAMPPSFGGASDSADDHAFPPLPGLDDVEPIASDLEAELAAEPPAIPVSVTPRTTISIGSAESHLRSRLELDPENWELRRQLGEALLDTGDREGGLYELELAMVGFEMRGFTDRAQEVVDVILKVNPASIAHHQKRVEYAVRSRDRGRLSYSYLELADSLFRSGSAEKAVAVYGRVLELDPENERAEFALATLAPDVLARLQGGPVKPERWTDELATITDGAEPEAAAPQTAAPEVQVPAEQSNGSPPREESSAAPYKSSLRVRFGTLELPVADWGEGVPRGPSAAQDKTPSAATNETPVTTGATESVADTGVPTATPVESAIERFLSEPAAEVPPDEEPGLPAPDASTGRFEPIVEDIAGDVSGPSQVIKTPFFVPEARRLTPHDAPVPRTPTPLPMPAPRLPTPEPAPIYREPTPLSVAATRNPTPEPAPVYRDPTPLSVAAVRNPTPYSEPQVVDNPLGDSDAEFIDLGEWLRNTEPVRSTRMQVEDPKPTGDEQADFEEMLRRFKRGVAENVEAEDYEAHYDLGVAYKEMGLIDEAIAQFQKSLRDPLQRVRSYEALGQCFVEKEQYPIAAALLQRATEVPGSDDQQLVGVLYLLGFATEHLGRPADALPYYLRVFAVDIEFRDVAERVAALGKLTK